MSEDLIKRSAAIRALNREKSDWNCDYNVPIDNCIKRLNKVKSADRPQGEWIFDPEILCSDIGVYSAGYRCSVCGKDYFKVDRMNYCPNCGARMKGGDPE